MTQSTVRQRGNLTSKALEAIRSQIIDGRLALGEALSEATLAAGLGVSKTPVREALLQLKQEGLVQIFPQRGTFVFEADEEMVRELCDFRRVLEIAALEHAMRRNWGKLVDTMEPCVDKMEVAVAAEDLGTYRVLDAEFHAALVRLTDNRFLNEAYFGVEFRIQALRTRLSLPHANNQETLREHRRIVERIASRDTDAAAAELIDHIDHTEKSYIDLLEGGLKL